MTDINHQFQTLSPEKNENAMLHSDTTGKATYASPKLVRIGSTAYETTFGPPRSSVDAFSGS